MSHETVIAGPDDAPEMSKKAQDRIVEIAKCLDPRDIAGNVAAVRAAFSKQDVTASLAASAMASQFYIIELEKIIKDMAAARN